MDLFPANRRRHRGRGKFHRGYGRIVGQYRGGDREAGRQSRPGDRVSDDAVGRFCVNKLQHYGVDAPHVSRSGGEARNSLALYESRVDGHQSVIYRNGAADFEMTVADVEAVDYQPVLLLWSPLAQCLRLSLRELRRFVRLNWRAQRVCQLSLTSITAPIHGRPPQVAEDVLSRAGRCQT